MKKTFWYIVGFVSGISYLVIFAIGWLFGFGFKNDSPRRVNHYVSHDDISNYWRRHGEK